MLIKAPCAAGGAITRTRAVHLLLVPHQSSDSDSYCDYYDPTIASLKPRELGMQLVEHWTLTSQLFCFSNLEVGG